MHYTKAKWCSAYNTCGLVNILFTVHCKKKKHTQKNNMINKLTLLSSKPSLWQAVYTFTYNNTYNNTTHRFQ